MPSIPSKLRSFFLTMTRIACRISVFIDIPFLVASLELYLDSARLRHFMDQIEAFALQETQAAQASILFGEQKC
jgi:hypothetical protein